MHEKQKFDSGSDQFDPTNSRRSGFVAVIGPPNAGKSTLINEIVGGKVSIVSPKVQTTRSRIRGIHIAGNDQIVLVDTPGIFIGAKTRLERSMVHAAWKGEFEADASLVLLDASKGICKDFEDLINKMKERKKRPLIAINKIDAIERKALLPLASKIDAYGIFKKIFMISALNGDGVPDLLNYLCNILPKGQWLYPEDQISDISERMLAAEITREKLFLQLHQELPYSAAVHTEQWKEREDGSIRVEQVIYVQKESHKIMVLGKSGKKIKVIGKSSREELTSILGRRVHLFIFVKVRARWPEDPERYRDLGLEFDIK